MLSTPLYSMYRMVCSAPDCGGIQIERMPELLDHDRVTNCQPHTHMFYEILWFTEAGGYHTIDFQRYPVEANTLFFLTPGQVHHFDTGARPCGYSIKICTDFFDKSGEDADLIRYTVFHSASECPYAHVTDEVASLLLLQTISRMEEEQQSDRFGHEEMVRLLARELLIQIRRHATRPGEMPVGQEAPAYRLFIRFRRMLEQEYTHLHQVSDYADRLQVSTRTLSAAVKQATGQTPLSFINDRLVLESKRLLRFSNLMVKEIAYHLGFDDPSNFVKFLKRQTGYLPGDFQTADAKGRKQRR